MMVWVFEGLFGGGLLFVGGGGLGCVCGMLDGELTYSAHSLWGDFHRVLSPRTKTKFFNTLITHKITLFPLSSRRQNHRFLEKLHRHVTQLYIFLFD